MAGVAAPGPRRGRRGLGRAARRHVRPTSCAPFLLERLADYKVPRRITVVDALPRNESGKVAQVPPRAWSRPRSDRDGELHHVDGRGDRARAAPDAQPAGPPQPADAPLHPRAPRGGRGSGGRRRRRASSSSAAPGGPSPRATASSPRTPTRATSRSTRRSKATCPPCSRWRRVGTDLGLRPPRHRPGPGELPGRRDRPRTALRPGRGGRGRPHRLPAGALHGRPAHQHVAVPPRPAVDEAAPADGRHHLGDRGPRPRPRRRDGAGRRARRRGPRAGGADGADRPGPPRGEQAGGQHGRRADGPLPAAAVRRAQRRHRPPGPRGAGLLRADRRGRPAPGGQGPGRGVRAAADPDRLHDAVARRRSATSR